VPCVAPARGASDGSWDDTVNSNPCGRTITSVANGVNYAADNLCLFHLMFKYGQLAVKPPYTTAATRR
jgi:hypothetical protein